MGVFRIESVAIPRSFLDMAKAEIIQHCSISTKPWTSVTELVQDVYRLLQLEANELDSLVTKVSSDDSSVNLKVHNRWGFMGCVFQPTTLIF